MDGGKGTLAHSLRFISPLSDYVTGKRIDLRDREGKERKGKQGKGTIMINFY